MKTIIIFMIMALLAMTANADSLEWGVSENADGYLIYHGEYSKNVGNVTTYDIDLLNIPYNTPTDIHATAYNDAGESEPSNIVRYTRPGFIVDDNPAPPVSVIIPGPITIIIGQ